MTTKTPGKDVPWPADKTQRWPITALRAYERNARKHDDAQIVALGNAIKRFGFTAPVLIAEDGTIIAGHGRVEAARHIGLAEVPVVVASGWTDEERKAFTIWDNQSSAMSTWDADLLRLEIGELQDEGFEIGLLGFEADEIDRMLDIPDPGDPEPKTEPKAKLSDRFGIPPFSVLNAREGWWQDRKRAWLALGIQSELGRGETAGAGLVMSETVQRLKPAADQAAKNARKANATPGGSAMPSASYGKDKARGDGRGRPING